MVSFTTSTELVINPSHITKQEGTFRDKTIVNGTLWPFLKPRRQIVLTIERALRTHFGLQTKERSLKPSPKQKPWIRKKAYENKESVLPPISNKFHIGLGNPF